MRNSLTKEITEELKNFDVTLYSALEDFTPEQWIPLIESRLNTKRYVDLLKNGVNLDDETKVKLHDLIGKFIKLNIDFPLKNKASEQEKFNLLIGHYFRSSKEKYLQGNNELSGRAIDQKTEIVDLLINSGDGLFYKKNDNNENYIPSVQQLSSSTILYLQRALLEVRGSNPNDANDFDCEQPIDEAIKKSKTYGIRHLANMSIDLRMSDDNIINDFKVLLRQYRKTSAFDPPTITQVKTKRWHKNKVLPYADLLLWQQWSGVELSENVIVKLLSDEEEKEPVNDPLFGTKRDYKEAISDSALSILRTSARSALKNA